MLHLQNKSSCANKVDTGQIFQTIIYLFLIIIQRAPSRCPLKIHRLKLILYIYLRI